MQSETTKRMFIILDREYEHICPKLSRHFGGPLKLKKCLYGADFNGKSWYETLDSFLFKLFRFNHSRVEDCLYIWRRGNDWLKLTNYVDDASYNFNNDKFREEFESAPKKIFNLSLMVKAKWHLGMEIKQTPENIILNQEQYVKNSVIQFEKSSKHEFKTKDSPSPNNFIPSKKDYLTTDLQTKEVKIWFGNLHYRSIIGALLYLSYCLRSDIAFVVNKLTTYSNNPDVVHHRAMLLLIGFLKGTSNRSLQFYSNLKDSPTYEVLLENNITIKEDTITTFSDSSWNDCVDAGRSTGADITIRQGVSIDHGSLTNTSCNV